MPSDNLLGRSVHQNWCHFIAAIDTGPNLLKWFRYKKILVGVYCISCLYMCTILVYWVRGSDWRMNKTLQHKEEKNFRWKSTVITKPKCLTTKGKYFTAKNVVFYISNNMEDYKSERLISTLFFFLKFDFFLLDSYINIHEHKCNLSRTQIRMRWLHWSWAIHMFIHQIIILYQLTIMITIYDNKKLKSLLKCWFYIICVGTSI